MFQKTKTSRLVCIAAFTLLFYASKSNAIVGGVEFTSGNPAPSGIVKVQGDAYVGSACTGALIAKNIVITASHCPGRSVTFQDGST
ncbi:MAG: trypsin-like serine protease, partial [Bdellovibrionota bacterium]